MQELQEKFIRKLEATNLEFIRSIIEGIRWEARLIGIKGARGVGKTTLILQYIKKFLAADESTLYVSLDNLWFSQNSLTELTDEFVKKGGKNLFLDEVHKYPNWSQEIKNIYDDYPTLKIIFTGSSLLEILNARADLSRRAIIYTMQGLSFREFLMLKTGIELPIYNLSEILNSHSALTKDINKKIKPLQYFETYLKSGYYPFFLEVPELYHQRLEEVVNLILEIELVILRKVDAAYIPKLKQLLHIIAESVPFIPNISKLSEKISINRNTFVSYLFYLEEAGLTKNLFKNAKGITRLQKPDKLYLENTNLQFALAKQNSDKGNMRETFFLNQVAYHSLVEYADDGDFKVEGKYLFELGGKNKSSKQLKDAPNAYVVSDDIEFGFGNKIPLWLFGFLY
jgi:predicted AAA+ superfamily ATPase